MEIPSGLEKIPSPSLLLFPELIGNNISVMLSHVSGRTELLRPHVKTHKLGEVVRMQMDHGITKVKCATLAEMEMAAKAGVNDALLAYQPVGPNIDRILRIRESYPDTKISAVVDSSEIAKSISAAVDATPGAPFPLFIDLDSGMHRTGIAPGEDALALALQIVADENLEFAGIHAYDGHIHQADVEERRADFDRSVSAVQDFASLLEKEGIAIPVIVAGGSPTFAMHADHARTSSIPWECSPGTPLLWDAGYGTNHPDLPFQAAAALLTRVISKPTPGQLCLDLGHKSVSAENPITNRVRFESIPDAVFLSQSEEHLVIETADADRWKVGDTLIGIPWHICPSLALHARGYLVEKDQASGDYWSIHARDRA